MTRPAIIYARFSTPSQERGDSLERQLRDCRDFCARHDLKVVAEVTDLGRSAYKGDHLSQGELGKLANRILAGEIERGTVLVFEKMDRLSRQKPRIVQRWIEDVCDRGITIAIRDPERWIDAKYLDDGSNMLALMDILMSSHAANLFSKNLSDRMASSWVSRRKKAREQGATITSMIPAWLYVDSDGEMRLNPERVAILERIFTMMAEGIGAWSIAKTLNEEGIEPWGQVRAQKAAKVRGWNHTYIRFLLTNPAILGDHHFTAPKGRRRVRTDEMIPGYYPVALPVELVMRARGVRQTRGSKTGGRYSAYGRNLFSQIAKCEHCGGNMILTGSGVHSAKPAYLQCTQAKKRAGCDRTGTFDYKLLEASVLSELLSIALDDRFFQSDDASLRQLVDAIADTEKALTDAVTFQRGYQDLAALRPNDQRLRGDWLRASEEVDRLDALLAEQKAKLASARGATSPQEHAERVLRVTNAMNSDDEEVMRVARLRVHASLRDVITTMRCKQEPDQPKQVFVSMAHGLVNYTFDNQGGIILAQDFRNSPDHIHGLTATEAHENLANVETILRRS